MPASAASGIDSLKGSACAATTLTAATTALASRNGTSIPVSPGRTTSGMPPTSLAAIKVLRLMAAGDLQTYRRLKIDDALMTEIEHVLTTQLEHHLDRRLKSLQFLHDMRARS